VAQIKIVTDSAADLPDEIIHEFDITVIPLTVTFGDHTYAETSLPREEFWHMFRGSLAPKTSQPALGAFQQAFAHLVDQGCQVLCATLTGVHSGTYNTARSAAQAFGDRVVVVDSRALSWGVGWQVIQAARMALQGVGMDRILDSLASLRERTHILIQLETVEYLRRGGRAARIMPVIDRFMRTLSLKPILDVVDGELKLLGVARSYQRGVERLRDEMLRLGPWEYLAVMHTRRMTVAKELANELARLTHVAREEIMVGETGAALSCHGGEGIIATVGVTAK
jgi:DegV family protein with EDD domain